MNEQQVGEIAEAAFRSHFGDVKIVRVNVRRGFDYDEDDSMLDVNIIYDGKYEQLNGGPLGRAHGDRLEGVAGSGGQPRLPVGPLHRQVRRRAARPGHRLTPWWPGMAGAGERSNSS